MSTEFLVHGPPGCGKTTWAASQAAHAVAKYGERGVLLTSLTRAAAQEIRSRDTGVAAEMAGTMHSLCYRALELRGAPILDTPAGRVAWNAFTEARGGWVLSEASAKKRDPFERAPQLTYNDKVYARLCLRRSRLDAGAAPSDEVGFLKDLRAWREEEGGIDFLGMIEEGVRDLRTAPGAPRVLLGDECQDWCALELALFDQWSKADGVATSVLIGDADQCHPPGTLIETPRGQVLIEKLIAEERVIGYSRREARFVGLRTGAKRIEEAREFAYSGELTTLDVGSSSLDCTDSHRCVFRFRRDTKATALYLMQRDTQFRVGTASLWYNVARYPAVGPLWRLRHERANSCWILAIYEDDVEARVQEALISTRWKIPQMVFKAPGGKRLKMSQPWLDRFWSKVGDNYEEARHCLRAFGQRIDLPLFTPVRGAENGRMARFIVAPACSIPNGDWIESPSFSGSPKPTWAKTRISRRKYTGTVHGLQVESSEGYGRGGIRTYVANRIVTHNSIYAFRGSSPTVFMDRGVPAEQRRVLQQSYRVPRLVHQTAAQMISQISEREAVEYRPRAADGEVRISSRTWKDGHALADALQAASEKGRTVMLLASCEYMLRPVLQELRAQGALFWNPYAPERGNFNPLGALHFPRAVRGKVATSGAERLLAFLAVGEYGVWSAKDLRRWTPAVSGILARGAPSRIDGLAGLNPPRLSLEDLGDLFLPGRRDEALAAARAGDASWMLKYARDRARLEYPVQIFAKGGHALLRSKPRIVVSTIHSVKGAESDTVLVVPDFSPQQKAGYEVHGRDDAHRLYYVAATRARENLTWLSPAGGWRGVGYTL